MKRGRKMTNWYKHNYTFGDSEEESFKKENTKSVWKFNTGASSIFCFYATGNATLTVDVNQLKVKYIDVVNGDDRMFRIELNNNGE